MHEFDFTLKKLEQTGLNNDEMVHAMRLAVKLPNAAESIYGKNSPTERAKTLFGTFRRYAVKHVTAGSLFTNAHVYFNLCLLKLRSEKRDEEVERIWRETLAESKRRARVKTDPLPPLK